MEFILSGMSLINIKRMKYETMGRGGGGRAPDNTGTRFEQTRSMTIFCAKP